jgi:hypothetical protein
LSLLLKPRTSIVFCWTKKEFGVGILEPSYSSERELEVAIAEAAQQHLLDRGAQVLVIKRFGLDVAVFYSTAGVSAAHFLEIKSFAQHHGRCGFGNGKGEGNQIRLLFDEVVGQPRPAWQLKVIGSSVGWILGNQTLPHGSPRFVFFNSEEAQAAAANGVRVGKQNNFRLSSFASRWITWPVLMDRIATFLDV